MSKRSEAWEKVRGTVMGSMYGTPGPGNQPADEGDKTMTSTIDTITDEQIKSLMQAAGQAGDLVQCGLCLVALGRWDEVRLDMRREVQARLRVDLHRDDAREMAREICADVIADADGR